MPENNDDGHKSLKTNVTNQPQQARSSASSTTNIADISSALALIQIKPNVPSRAPEPSHLDSDGGIPELLPTQPFLDHLFHNYFEEGGVPQGRRRIFNDDIETDVGNYTTLKETIFSSRKSPNEYVQSKTPPILPKDSTNQIEDDNEEDMGTEADVNSENYVESSLDDVFHDYPENDKENPEYVIENPEYVIENPEDVIQNPKDVIQNPEDVIQNPEDVIEDPEDVIQNPEDVIEDPEDVIENPEEVIEDPEDVIENPEEVIEDPEDVIENPEEVIENPEDVIENTEDIIENLENGIENLENDMIPENDMEIKVENDYEDNLSDEDEIDDNIVIMEEEDLQDEGTETADIDLSPVASSCDSYDEIYNINENKEECSECCGNLLDFVINPSLINFMTESNNLCDGSSDVCGGQAEDSEECTGEKENKNKNINSNSSLIEFVTSRSLIDFLCETDNLCNVCESQQEECQTDLENNIIQSSRSKTLTDYSDSGDGTGADVAFSENEFHEKDNSTGRDSKILENGIASDEEEPEEELTYKNTSYRTKRHSQGSQPLLDGVVASSHSFVVDQDILEKMNLAADEEEEAELFGLGDANELIPFAESVLDVDSHLEESDMSSVISSMSIPETQLKLLGHEPQTITSVRILTSKHENDSTKHKKLSDDNDERNLEYFGSDSTISTYGRKNSRITIYPNISSLNVLTYPNVNYKPKVSPKKNVKGPNKTSKSDEASNDDSRSPGGNKELKSDKNEEEQRRDPFLEKSPDQNVKEKDPSHPAILNSQENQPNRNSIESPTKTIHLRVVNSHSFVDDPLETSIETNNKEKDSNPIETLRVLDSHSFIEGDPLETSAEKNDAKEDKNRVEATPVEKYRKKDSNPLQPTFLRVLDSHSFIEGDPIDTSSEKNGEKEDKNLVEATPVEKDGKKDSNPLQPTFLRVVDSHSFIDSDPLETSSKKNDAKEDKNLVESTPVEKDGKKDNNPLQPKFLRVVDSHSFIDSDPLETNSAKNDEAKDVNPFVTGPVKPDEKINSSPSATKVHTVDSDSFIDVDPLEKNEIKDVEKKDSDPLETSSDHSEHEKGPNSEGSAPLQKSKKARNREETVTSYVEEEIPLEEWLSHENNVQGSKTLDKDLKMQCTVTEIDAKDGSEPKRFLEINGNVISIPNEMSQDLLKKEIENIHSGEMEIKQVLQNFKTMQEKLKKNPQPATNYISESQKGAKKLSMAKDRSTALKKHVTITYDEDEIPVESWYSQDEKQRRNSKGPNCISLKCDVVEVMDKSSGKSRRKSIVLDNDSLMPISMHSADDAELDSDLQKLEEGEKILEKVVEDFREVMTKHDINERKGGPQFQSLEDFVCIDDTFSTSDSDEIETKACEDYNYNNDLKKEQVSLKDNINDIGKGEPGGAMFEIRCFEITQNQCGDSSIRKSKKDKCFANISTSTGSKQRMMESCSLPLVQVKNKPLIEDHSSTELTGKLKSDDNSSNTTTSDGETQKLIDKYILAQSALKVKKGVVTADDHSSELIKKRRKENSFSNLTISSNLQLLEKYSKTETPFKTKKNTFPTVDNSSEFIGHWREKLESFVSSSYNEDIDYCKDNLDLDDDDCKDNLDLLGDDDCKDNLDLDDDDRKENFDLLDDGDSTNELVEKGDIITRAVSLDPKLLLQTHSKEKTCNVQENVNHEQNYSGEEDEEEEEEEEEDYEKEMFLNKWKVKEWLNRQPPAEEHSDIDSNDEKGEPLYINSYGYGSALANPPAYPPLEQCENSVSTKAVPIGYGIPRQKKATRVIPNLSKTLALAGEQQGRLLRQLNAMNFPWRKRKGGKATWVKESKATWRPHPQKKKIKNKKGVKDVFLLRIFSRRKKSTLNEVIKDSSCEVLFEPYKDIVTKSGRKIRVHSRTIFMGDTLPEQVQDAVEIIKEKLRNNNTESANNNPDEQGDKYVSEQKIAANSIDILDHDAYSTTDAVHNEDKSVSLKLNAQTSADEIRRISSFLRKTRHKSIKHHTIFSLKESQYKSSSKTQSFMKKMSTNFSRWTERTFHFHLEKNSRRVHPTVEQSERILPATVSSSSLLEQPQLEQERSSSNDCFVYQFMSNLVSYFQYLRRRRRLRRELQIPSALHRQSLSRFEPLRRTVGRGLPIMNEADMASHIFHRPHVCPSPHMRHCRRNNVPKMQMGGMRIGLGSCDFSKQNK